jgi:predicted component of type VI protein secretion system
MQDFETSFTYNKIIKMNAVLDIRDAILTLSTAGDDK